MKAKVLFTILLLGILPCFAQKSFFGLTLGKTTLEQAKEILQKQNIPFDESKSPYFSYFLSKDHTRFLLSGYSWDEFKFEFDRKQDFALVEACFYMHNLSFNEQEKKYESLRQLLLSKYHDYKIAYSGMVKVLDTIRWHILLEGNNMTIDLLRWWGQDSSKCQPYYCIRLTYHSLETLPTPPSDEL